MAQHPPEYINDGDIFENIPDPNLFQTFLNNMVNLDVDPNLQINTVPTNVNFMLNPDEVISYQLERTLETIYLEKSKREFVEDVIINRDYSRWNSLCMSQHTRLGVNSPLRMLPNDVFLIIRKFYREELLKMIDNETIEDIILIVEQTNCSIETAVNVYIENDRDIVNSIISLK
jgi:hypothetical protein